MKSTKEKVFYGFFELVIAMVYVASPTLVFAVGAGLYYLKYPHHGKSIPSLIIFVGFVIGCAWAWKVHSKNGTLNTWSQLYATPELDDMPDKKPRRPTENTK